MIKQHKEEMRTKNKEIALLKLTQSGVAYTVTGDTYNDIWKLVLDAAVKHDGLTALFLMNKELSSKIDALSTSMMNAVKCILCCDHDRQVVFIECGHYSVCRTCASKLTPNQDLNVVCPTCRVLTKYKNVF